MKQKKGFSKMEDSLGKKFLTIYGISLQIIQTQALKSLKEPEILE